MIISIDQSLTCTGVCLMMKCGQYHTLCIKPGKLRGVERLEFIKEMLENKILGLFGKITNGTIEGYSYGSVGRTFELGELGGMIKMLFKEYKISFEVIPPTVWKKTIVGKGNANKSTVRWKVEKQYGHVFKTQDECDAWCMAEHVRRKL